MELQIKDLVSSIRKDGIDAANKKAEEIIAKANAQAQEIVSSAKSEAQKIKQTTENEVSVMKESIRLSAEHAKRDAMLSFKDSVQKEFEKLLKADVKKAVDQKLLAELIKAALNEQNPADYEAQVAEITDGLKGELAALIEKGLEIKPTKGVHIGFKLAAKDSSGYFDCSDDEIVKMIDPFFPELNI